ncbi:MAG: hemolysin family protein [Planctomycetota bacterium]|nr:hemolysin family protein [Planctomycetota bacterium]
MFFLLAMSFTFSGCETSLFSLTVPELNRIRASPGRLDRIIAGLHANLKPLLPILLFCNMAVNILIYSLSASIASGLAAGVGSGSALLFSLASLSAVLFLGEVFPKQFAISSSLTVARATAIQVWCCRRLLAKPMRLLNSLVNVCERMISPRRGKDQTELREEELRLLIEISRQDGVISEGEYELIDGVVELPEVRVRDIMTPRVDIFHLAPDASIDAAAALARQCRHCKLPVLDAGRNDFSGWIDARDFLLERPAAISGGRRGIEAHIRGFRFFSEHDRADQALERLKGKRAELFAVVDERGQIAGFFTLGDIMDEVLGGRGDAGVPPPRETADGGGYIISGRLSVREWRELFGVADALPKSATLGGLVASLLGRMPRPGDRVQLKNLWLTVVSTNRNRVGEVEVRLTRPAPTEERGAAEKT